jgi:hypothetical protein
MRTDGPPFRLTALKYFVFVSSVKPFGNANIGNSDKCNEQNCDLYVVLYGCEEWFLTLREEQIEGVRE